MVAVLAPKRKPPPDLPDEAGMPPERHFIERHVVEQVHGKPGKDGRDGTDGKDGRNARPMASYEYDVVYRRDAVVRKDFYLDGFVPRSDEARAFISSAKAGMPPVMEAPALLRLSLGHDITEEAIVGSRVRTVQEGKNIFASILPVRFSPSLRDTVSTIRLVLTIEVHDE